MQERLLHFIWKHQYFDGQDLRSDGGETVQVLNPGRLNDDQGPDFLDAELLINNIRWRGHVEIHTKPLYWRQHGHHLDPRYNNVILHVVWEDGEHAVRDDGTRIPSVILQPRTPTSIIERYHELVNGLPAIPCKSQLATVKGRHVIDALDDAMRDRYSEKARSVLKRWHANGKDWEQTSFEWLARHFGFSINNEAFETLAASVPFKILSRHRDRIFQLEAILFGMAGMLNRKNCPDLYYNRLKEEFSFLKYKYGLRPRMQGPEWKLLRLRPSNFPSLRIAQLAMLIHMTDGKLYDGLSSEKIISSRVLRPSDYWRIHYDFGKKRKKEGGTMSTRSYRQLLMNTIIPFTWARSYTRGEYVAMRNIFDLLLQLEAEDNRIVRLWKETGVSMESALDSQGYLALYRQKCSRRQCLSCPVGTELLRTA